jgi:non-ribosomal peptide synthetase component F
MLDAELGSRLKSLAQGEQVTLFMLLLAAFQTLLSYLTGREDVVVGTDVAGRNRAETEGLIGFFVNQLVLRTRVEPKASFRRLLGEVRETALAAYAHQDLPFEKLVETLSPARDPGHRPIFQVKMNVQNVEAPTPAVRGLTLSAVSVGNDVLDLDLMLVFAEAHEGLGGWLHYNTDLFDARTAARIVSRLETLLREAAADPEVAVADLLRTLAELDRRDELSRRREREESRRDKFARVKPVALRLPRRED